MIRKLLLKIALIVKWNYNKLQMNHMKESSNKYFEYRTLDAAHCFLIYHFEREIKTYTY